VTTAAVSDPIFAAPSSWRPSFKLMDTAERRPYIASAGFPLAQAMAWLAALLELALVAGFLPARNFFRTRPPGRAYVIFPASPFPRASRWAGNQAEFGFFVIISHSLRAFCLRPARARTRVAMKRGMDHPAMTGAMARRIPAPASAAWLGRLAGWMVRPGSISQTGEFRLFRVFRALAIVHAIDERVSVSAVEGRNARSFRIAPMQPDRTGSLP